ncbi:MAG: transglycosylase SLT domain-containing protein [Candidatus Methylumidiphilus sp.]
MKHRIPNSKLICCASIFALSLAACSNNNKLKNDNLTDNGPKQSTGHLVKLKKGHRTDRLAGKFPDPRSYDNLWDRLFDRFDIPDVSNQEIDREVSWFINHPTYIDRVQSRAEPFLYSIVKQLEKQNMPGELALLPVIESAFLPHAVSPAHAAGIWQFIPATGRHYGLKSSYSYDGRRDIYASTRAAIKYLKKMHTQFNGDWLLAIAGYNCGEGAVARAIQKNMARGLPTDFWSLDLPQETRSYVPRLLAVAKIFNESETYGISLRPIPNKALYKTVVMKDQVDLALAANAADMSLDKLFALNPGFKRQQVDVNGSYRLFIPAHKKIVDFKEELARQVAARNYGDQPGSTPTDDNLTATPPAAESHAPLPSPTRIPVSAPSADIPDSIPEVAPADTGAQAPIRSADPKMAEAETLPPETAIQTVEEPPPAKIGRLKSPGNLPDEPVWQTTKSEPPSQKSNGYRETRETAVPESSALAQIYPNDSPVESNISVASYERIASSARERQSAKLAAKNARRIQEELLAKERSKLVERELLASSEREERNLRKGGNKTFLKNREEPSVERRPIDQEITGKKAAYVVKEGDTLYSIARKHAMDVDDLKKINRVSDADEIKWGQSMKVAAKDVVEKPTASKALYSSKMAIPTSKYTAHDGETLFSISRRFNVSVADLRKWNGIKADRQFRSGSNISVSGEKN